MARVAILTMTPDPGQLVRQTLSSGVSFFFFVVVFILLQSLAGVGGKEAGPQHRQKISTSANTLVSFHIPMPGVRDHVWFNSCGNWPLVCPCRGVSKDGNLWRNVATSGYTVYVLFRFV